MNNHYELVILGGGCAGLSLSMRLAEHGNLAPNTLILEKRAEYLNDRTWCFWDEGEPALKDWADHAWQRFVIKNGVEQFSKSCKDHVYKMLSAETFYKRATTAISANAKRINLLKNQTIIGVTKTPDQTWCITTNDTIYTATKVVDTRPASGIQDADSILWQSFLGDEIETSTNVFDVSEFVLMDFDVTFTDGLGFVYVLPYAANRALIEYTVFSSQLMTAERLRVCLDLALQAYVKGSNFKVIRTEQGQLPMGNTHVKHSNDPSYIHAGLFAGAARPSSGYAFQRIQSWATQCAEAIIRQQPLVATQKDTIFLATMDGIFLNVLKSNPSASISLFFGFFLNCKTATIIRFLSDHATLLDHLAIIACMPKRLFLKELPRYFSKRLRSFKLNQTLK